MTLPPSYQLVGGRRSSMRIAIAQSKQSVKTEYLEDEEDEVESRESSPGYENSELIDEEDDDKELTPEIKEEEEDAENTPTKKRDKQSKKEKKKGSEKYQHGSKQRIRVFGGRTRDEGSDIPEFTELVKYLWCLISARKEEHESDMNYRLGNENKAILSNFERYVCINPVYGWQRTKDISISLSRWLNTRSLDVGAAGKMPVEPNERPRAFKAPKIVVRGRPRKDAIPPASMNYLLSSSSEKGPKKKGKKRGSGVKVEELKNDPPEITDINMRLVDENGYKNIPVFTSTSYDFEVDVSARTEQFESNQVVDIYDWLLAHSKCKVEQAVSSAEDNVDQTPSLDPLLLKKRKIHKQRAFMLCCGGPIAVLKYCLRKTTEGNELLAVATFADEKQFASISQVSYLQFWTIPPPSSLDEQIQAGSVDLLPSLAFFLEVPVASSILALCWCPSFHEAYESTSTSRITDSTTKSAKRAASRKSQKSSKDQCSADNNNNNNPKLPLENISGLLAVATSGGRLIVYSIPRDVSALLAANDCSLASASAKPTTTKEAEDDAVVLTTEPAFSFIHPQVNIKRAQDDQKPTVTNKVPFIAVHWSPFLSGRQISAVSASWRVYVWDVSMVNDYLSNDLQPVTVFFDHWTSPPISSCWLGPDKLAIGFKRGGFAIVQLIPSAGQQTEVAGEIQAVTLIDGDTSWRNVGAQMVVQPTVFANRFVSFDGPAPTTAGLMHPGTLILLLGGLTRSDGVLNASSLTQEEEGDLQVLTLPNCHQIRLAGMSICPRTGIIASVGSDGRLVHAMCNYLSPPNLTGRCFIQCSRPLLQLIARDKSSIIEENNDDAHRQAPEPDPNGFVRPPCYSHELCAEHKCIEIRLGDCTLVDQKNSRESRRIVPEASLDRRLDSLHCVDVSWNWAGWTACGGEAGLVFVISSSL